MDDIKTNLIAHVETLTRDIGERSVRYLERLDRARDYIRTCYEAYGLSTRLEEYIYRRHPVANVVAETGWEDGSGKRYLLGAHYDSVRGTVGADDNASAVAVQLETARLLAR